MISTQHASRERICQALSQVAIYARFFAKFSYFTKSFAKLLERYFKCFRQKSRMPTPFAKLFGDALKIGVNWNSTIIICQSWKYIIAIRHIEDMLLEYIFLHFGATCNIYDICTLTYGPICPCRSISLHLPYVLHPVNLPAARYRCTPLPSAPAYGIRHRSCTSELPNFG